MTQAHDEIIKAFRLMPPPYQRVAVDRCLADREGMTDRLLLELNNWIESEDPAADTFGMLPFYALEILSFWREPKLHKPLIRILSEPSEKFYDVLDDYLTESADRDLLHSCNGDFGDIRHLLLNESANEYGREAAINALTQAAIRGQIEIESLKAEFVSLLESYSQKHSQEKEQPCDAKHESVLSMSGKLVNAVTDLHPGGYVDYIEKLYNNEIVPSDFIGFDEVLEASQQTPEEVRRETALLFDARNEKKSVHDSMSWWDCFRLPLTRKVGRNERCPCGSGKKYKYCCI